MYPRCRPISWSLPVVLTFTLLAGAAEKSTPKVKAPSDAAGLAQTIDREIEKVLTTDKLKPAPLADDSEFVRRAYLDITGVIPPGEKVRQFLDSGDANKRAKLIDELLADANYGRHMADLWQSMMLPRNSDNRRLDNEPFTDWLREKFNANAGWDKVAAEILTSSGAMDKNPAVAFYLANPTADKMTDQVSRLFMGVQLQCAQCHNHPFTSYKQDDYWGMAAYFLKVRSDRVNGAVRNGVSPAVVEDPKLKAQKGLPESARTLPPKPLQDAGSKVAANEMLRPVFAKWLTSPDNKFFARAMVNRTWHQMFGRGIVNPVDDMHDSQTPSHPELLKTLTEEFVASGYDVKLLIRAICNTKAYQRTARASGGDDDVVAKFGRMPVKVLTPEQLYDSLETVLGKPTATKAEMRANAQKGQGRGPRAAFIAFFDVEDNIDPTEYVAGIPQALRLMNSGQTNATAVLLPQALKAKSPAEAFELIYLSTLARRPAVAEVEKLTEYVTKVGDSKKAYGDIIWAVLNSSEFATCR